MKIRRTKTRYAAIFDMDGVIVDNHHYHFLAWEAFCNKYDIPFDHQSFLTHFGGTNQEVMTALFGRELSAKELNDLSTEKEKLYRDLYRPYIQEVFGLRRFLEALVKSSVPVAVATSGPYVNVKFVLRELKLEKYFKKLIYDTYVKQCKPHPEVFLRAADMLKVSPDQCIVFEDSLRGIEAGNRAGMRVVGIATTNKPEELRDTVLTVNDFTELNLDIINRLMNNQN